MESGDRLHARLSALRCSGCGRAYGEGHARIRAERGGISFVDLLCRACGGQATAIATVVGEAESGPTIALGELDEVAAPVVGITDMLEMRHFLEDFDGDFRRVLGGPGPASGTTAG